MLIERMTMNKIKKILAFVSVLVMCIAMIPVDYARADEKASISISSSGGTVGSTVTVTVTISASSAIDAASVPVSYDNSVIKPVSAGNSGVVSFSLLDASQYGSSESISMQFEIIAAGTTTLSVAGDAKVSVNGERATISSSSSGKVTGTAPVSYSSDNALKSLQISPGSLSPAFSPDTTTYSASVGADVTELVVSAAANDSKASVSVSGTRMDPGNNTTTITVTAENGSVKKYVIYTTRAVSDKETAAEADSNAATDSATEAATEELTEAASQSENADGTVTINGKKYSVAQDLSEVTLPDGYQEIDYDYNGQKINAAEGIKTGLILMYLESGDEKSGDENSENGGFYIYDEKTKTFSPYNTVAEPEITYVVLPITDSLDKPSGYTLTKFTMNGREVEVLMDADRKYCLFYGVDSLGTTGWFRYSVSDGTIQAYTDAKADTAKVAADTKKEKSSSGNGFLIAMVIVLGIVAAALIGLSVVLYAKLTRIRKVFNMASKDGVDLDSYTEKEIDEYDMDDEDDYDMNEMDELDDIVEMDDNEDDYDMDDMDDDKDDYEELDNMDDDKDDYEELDNNSGKSDDEEVEELKIYDIDEDE